MARPSTIQRLPAEVRETIGRLREQGRTIDEILGKLRELEVQVSRSALGRHVQRIDAVAEEIRKSRAVAEAIVQRFGEAPESKTARLNIELAHALVMKCMVGEDGRAVTLAPREAQFVADALYRLSRAAKDDVDREIKIRDKVRAEIAAKASATAKQAQAELKKAGLSAETIRRIETEILGIAR